MFLSVDDAGFTAFINHRVDFFFRNLLVVLLNAEHFDQHLGRERKQFHERHSQNSQPVNRFGNHTGNRIRAHLTDTFRNQFTDHDREVRDQNNDYSHRGTACRGSRNVNGIDEEIRKRINQCRLTDNTGKNTDGSNADLNRRKRSRRILRKR